MNSYYIESLGCPKNLVDSEVFASIFERAGYQRHPQPEGATIVLVNTCSFIFSALMEFEDVIEDLLLLKREKQIKQLLVTGCLMNRMIYDYQQMYPEVDAWLNLKAFGDLEKLLGLEPLPQNPRAVVEPAYHRYLRISDGCSNHCSYCTIPSIRGELVSTPIEELIREAEALAADQEYPPQELIVVAQDTCNYGLDLYGRKALPELLEKLHAIPQFRWLRVLYLHPDHFEPSWLELWKRLPKLLPYFEIPIQHTHDRILKLMNRQKGRQQLLELFQGIGKEIPEAVLRTTLIAGFPTENRSEHLAQMKFIEQVPLMYLGAFNYSREEGTPAYDLKPQLPFRTIDRRCEALIAKAQDLAAPLIECYVGDDLEILIEDKFEEEPDTYVGRAWFQTPDIDGITYVHAPELKLGSIIRTRILDAIDFDLFAQPVTEKESS